jgi:hypothetical protein
VEDELLFGLETEEGGEVNKELEVIKDYITNSGMEIDEDSFGGWEKVMSGDKGFSADESSYTCIVGSQPAKEIIVQRQQVLTIHCSTKMFESLEKEIIVEFVEVGDE